jgi:hypothetical protein
MSQATLLNVPDDYRGRSAFEFEHAMAHREVMIVMGPLTQWSVMPYFIDPARYQAPPGTNWHRNHQQAHDDVTTYLPADGTALEPGIPSSQVVQEGDLTDPERRTWWTFINHQEHYVSNAAIPVQGYTGRGLTISALPWWMLNARLVATFW